MMIRDTSIQTYNIIKENGILGQLQWEVYDYLFHNGPTYQQYLTIARNDLSRSLSPRFAELERMGAIKEVGRTISQYTKHEVMLWDVTSNIPRKLDPQPAQLSRKKLEEKVSVLNEAIEIIKEVSEINCELCGLDSLFFCVHDKATVFLEKTK